MIPVIRSIQGKVSSQIREPEENGSPRCPSAPTPSDPVKPTPPRRQQRLVFVVLLVPAIEPGPSAIDATAVIFVSGRPRPPSAEPRLPPFVLLPECFFAVVTVFVRRRTSPPAAPLRRPRQRRYYSTPRKDAHLMRPLPSAGRPPPPSPPPPAHLRSR
jgi:hypothetical protein